MIRSESNSINSTQSMRRPNMQKFYFTYSLQGQPFKGGWTIVRASSAEVSIKAFEIFHPVGNGKIFNFAAMYTEDQFKQTKMRHNGNFGAYTQEFIDIYRTVIDEEDIIE